MAEIKYARFEYRNGRSICFGQLYMGEEKIFDGSLAQILQVVADKELEVLNALEILDLLVRKNGFAV